MAIINTDDLTKLPNLLVLSTKARWDTPDGNIYIDNVNRQIQIMDKAEVPRINLNAWTTKAASMIDNPMDTWNAWGLSWKSLFTFIKLILASREVQRRFSKLMEIVFLPTGSFELKWGYVIPDWDLSKVKSTWLKMETASGNKYYMWVNNKDLKEDDVSYYIVGSGTPLALPKWPFNLLINIPVADMLAQSDIKFYFRGFGKIAQVVNIKSVGLDFGWGYIFAAWLRSEDSAVIDKTWLNDVKNSTGDFAKLRVVRLATAKAVSGLGADWSKTGNFSLIVQNPDGVSLAKVRAWLDYKADQDVNYIYNVTDESVAESSWTYTIRNNTQWRRLDTLYWWSDDAIRTNQLNIGGKLCWVYIENLNNVDRLIVTSVDDSWAALISPFKTTVNLIFNWLSPSIDPNWWLNIYVQDGAWDKDFNKPGAEKLKDNNWNGIDLTTSDISGNKYSFDFSYDSDTSWGTTAGTDKNIVIRSSGVEKIAEYYATFTLIRAPIININVPLEAPVGIV